MEDTNVRNDEARVKNDEIISVHRSLRVLAGERRDSCDEAWEFGVALKLFFWW